MNDAAFPGAPPLPTGVYSRLVDNSNALTTHVLETGRRRGNQPLILLLHGFPELAYRSVC